MINILLVDDEREEREGIAYLIQKYRYPFAISQAANGKKALEYIEKNPVDILFTDVKMPIMNGLELARIVNQCFPEIKIIIFSAYGEFDYAKQALEANAVNYLLKPIEVEEFCQVMEQMLERIQTEKEQREEQLQQGWQNRQNVFYRLLTGASIHRSEREEMGQYLFGGKSACRLVHVELEDNFFERWEELFLNLVKMYLGNRTEYIPLFSNEACLLIREKEYLDRELLKKQLQKLMRDVSIYTKHEAVAIVSKCMEDMNGFEQEAEGILEIQREVFGFGEEILWTEKETVQEHYSSNIEAVRRQLLLAIDAGHVELIETYADLLVKTVAASSKISKIYVQNLFYTVFQAFYDKNPDIRHERILNSSDSMFYAKSARSMVEYFRNSIHEMLDSMKDKPQDDSAEIQKIKNLVEKEYMRDITLGYVAEKVHLAPAYVSYIFKKETGQTLIKYITEVRMEKARMLLEQGELKIVQIARACGYENQSYFNRAFKNYFGVTPKQFGRNN